MPRPPAPRTLLRRLPSLPPVVLAILVLCVLPELVLQGADHGLWGTRQWRNMAYGWGGFWPGLFRGWLPNYPGQRWGMFLSYGFLHAGFWHLATNMITLVSLALPIVARVGQRRFLALYVLSMIGGGAGYAALSASTQPMVGASGALFGLAGAWAAWEYIDRFTAAERLWPVLRLLAILVVLNVVLWWAMHGLLAWQTHLGGFLVGWSAAFILDPRPRFAGEEDDEDEEEETSGGGNRG